MFQQQERMIAACFVGALLALTTSAAQSQAPSGEPLKIGYGISQTGANGKSALLPAQKIWEEDISPILSSSLKQGTTKQNVGAVVMWAGPRVTLIKVVRSYLRSCRRGGSIV